MACAGMWFHHSAPWISSGSPLRMPMIPTSETYSRRPCENDHSSSRMQWLEVALDGGPRRLHGLGVDEPLAVADQHGLLPRTGETHQPLVLLVAGRDEQRAVSTPERGRDARREVVPPVPATPFRSWLATSSCRACGRRSTTRTGWPAPPPGTARARPAAGNASGVSARGSPHHRRGDPRT